MCTVGRHQQPTSLRRTYLDAVGRRVALLDLVVLHPLGMRLWVMLEGTQLCRSIHTPRRRQQQQQQSGECGKQGVEGQRVVQPGVLAGTWGPPMGWSPGLIHEAMSWHVPHKQLVQGRLYSCRSGPGRAQAKTWYNVVHLASSVPCCLWSQ